MCVVSSNGDVNCTGGGSDGGSGSSEPGSPGQVDPYTCAAPGECEKLAIEAAWSLLESDGVKGEISLVSVKAVEWPDSCLGNDNREIACAEVITPGFIVILQRNGVEYEFHTDTNGRAVGAP
jgi:hypothetical protein